MDRKIKPKAKKNWRVALILVLVFGLSFALVHSLLSNNSVQLNEETLMVKQVSRQAFQEYISTDALALPEKTVVIDALVSGKVVERMIENGAVLKKGSQILTLQNIDLELDILNRETAVLDLINNIRQTRINLELNNANRQKELADADYQMTESQRLHSMNEKLWQEEVISESEFLESRNRFLYEKNRKELLLTIKKQDSISSMEQLRQMKNSLAQANKNLEVMKTKLNDLVVKAPIDGQLTNFELEEGQLISVGENIGQLDAQTGYKVRAQVDQYYLNRIARGQKASVLVNGKTYGLQVSRVFPSVSNNFFAADLEFIENQPPALTRGQNLIVKIELGQARESLVLPKGSFFQSTGGQWVFVLDGKESKAHRQEIKLGKQNPDYFEVLEGLEPGDKVIVSSYNGFENYTELNF